MIENDKQLEITKQELEKFEKALRYHWVKYCGVPNWISDLEENAIRSQIADLKQQIHEYEGD